VSPNDAGRTRRAYTVIVFFLKRTFYYLKSFKHYYIRLLYNKMYTAAIPQGLNLALKNKKANYIS
jgi:CTP:phosphocholine cytidylyltransferase-like protein